MEAPTKEEIEAIFRWLGACAKENLERDGRLMPLATLFTDKGPVLVGFADETLPENWTETAEGALRVMCHEQKPYAFSFLAECWMARAPVAQGAKAPSWGQSTKELIGYDKVSDSPDKIEVIVATLHTLDDQRFMRTAQIRRKKGKPTIDPDELLVPMTYDGVEGRPDGRWFRVLR